MRSLRRQLIAWIIGMLTAVGLLGGVLSVYLAWNEANTYLDHQLHEIARSIDEGSQLPAMQKNYNAENKKERARDFVIQVWYEKRPMVSSRPGFDIQRRSTTGFWDANWEGARWRVFTMIHKDRTVQVSQSEDLRFDLAIQSAMTVLLPVLILIPLSWLLVVIVINQLLRPLQGVTASVVGRDIKSDKPLSTENLPDEVTPLIKAMNDLILRLGKALKMQRQFLSDAAHSLRTPLAALQLQIENIATNQTRDDMTVRIKEMRQGSQRATHMVKQLLQIARYDAANDAVVRREIELETVLKECIAEAIPMAHMKNIDIGIVHMESKKIKCDENDVHILISNLLDNAIRYTPSGGKVDISMYLSDANIILDIQDSGIGIPGGDLPHVFDRFYRTPGQAAEGTGIGLAIVKAIADREAMTVTLRNRDDGRGLIARVNIPLSN